MKPESMGEKNRTLQNQLPFDRLKRSLVLSFFLSSLVVILATLVILPIRYQENDTMVSSDKIHITVIAIAIFFAIVLLLYKAIIRPAIEAIRSNSKEQQKLIEQNKSILENTSDLIWAIDNSYTLFAFNTPFAQMIEKETGIKPLVGDSMLNKEYSKLDFSTRKGLYDKALQGEAFETDLKVHKKDKTLYYELSFRPIMDSENKVTGCSILRRDITLRVEMYEELRKGEGFLKEAQEIANIGNWNWDLIANEIKWSDHLYKLFDLNPDDFEANYQGLMEIIHPEDQETFGISIENCLTTNQPHDVIHRIVMPEGSIRHVHQKGKVYQDDEGTPLRMAGTIQDVTQLEEAKSQIMRQYNELQNFVYIVSHNVRAPISTLQSLVDIIEPGNEALNAEIISGIEITVDTLDRTIKDLNHSLSLKNVKETTFEEVDLRKVLKDIEHLLALDIQSSNTTIEYSLSKAPKTVGIKSYFTNILFNLIMNSIKYKADNVPPHIKVTSMPTLSGGIEISVTDNGKGMDLTPERKKRIFDMYGKLSGASEGRGMGLYLAKTQAEAMNGIMKVESEPNKGTKFKLAFNNKLVSA